MNVSAPRPIYAPEPLTQVRIESEIARLCALLEATTDELAKASEASAEHEIAWKLAEASALLRSDQKSAELRKAGALVESRTQYANHVRADAVRDSIQEKCRTLRAQLDSLRTLSANVRAQV